MSNQFECPQCRKDGYYIDNSDLISCDNYDCRVKSYAPTYKEDRKKIAPFKDVKIFGRFMDGLGSKFIKVAISHALCYHSDTVPFINGASNETIKFNEPEETVTLISDGEKI